LGETMRILPEVDGGNAGRTSDDGKTYRSMQDGALEKQYLV